MIDLASKVLHEAQHAWEKFNYDTNFAYTLEETDNWRILQGCKQNRAHCVNNKSNWLQLVFKTFYYTFCLIRGHKIKTDNQYVSNIETSQSICDEVIKQV